MIAGECSSSAGDVLVQGVDARNDRSRARPHLGYCPQRDYLPDYLTVRETLGLFARLRGIAASARRSTVAELIDAFQLNEFANTLVQKLRFRIHFAIDKKSQSKFFQSQN